MRDQGFISNRIFDVFGSGGVVVSDDVAGLSEVFDDLVPTYRSVDELRTVIHELLHDHYRRMELSQKASALVHSEHTFDRRAQQIADLIEPLLRRRSRDLSGRTFDEPVFLSRPD
jgi:spore maturation protein CgeB